MDSEKTKAAIEELLRKLSVSFSSIESFEDPEDGITRFSVKTEEPNSLIGRNGVTLLAVNHIIRKMTGRSDEESGVNFIIDVNDYQKNKLDELKQKARMMAERARFFKSSVELEPMSSYERMIVHSFLSSSGDVVTESAGEGPGRHVVIKYKETND